ncbi:MAG TPA: sigma-70 family RNA polymerase sigma factor [Thermoanaerobaculia bacterium]|nr:sigma-70 family RNA polymerase sigma factor [Thermoanaerobaculia bacterium]
MDDALSDEEIVARILRGEEDLFPMLVRRYQSRLVAHLSRVVGSREEALDLSQEILLKVFQALPRYNAEYKFSTWIFRIASNAGIDFLRKRRIRTVSMDAPPPGEPEENAPTREFPSSGLDPYGELRNQERRAKIGREIAALPPEFRELIGLRHFAGLSYEEIAETKQMPLGTVKNKLFRARAVLKSRLAGELT